MYKAVDTKSGSNVVIKVYHKAKMQPKHHHKLLREIEAMEKMNGPYVAELHGTFSNEDSVCLVMVRGPLPCTHSHALTPCQIHTCPRGRWVFSS